LPFSETNTGPDLKTDQSAQLNKKDDPSAPPAEKALHIGASKHKEAKKKEEIRQLNKLEKKKKEETSERCRKSHGRQTSKNESRASFG